MSEAQILKDVLELCHAHPAVKRAWRQNSGMANIGGRYVRFGEEGHADVHGFLKSGRFFAIECKRLRERATKSQQTFLDDVKAAGGISGIARSAEDAKAILDSAVPRETLQNARKSRKRLSKAHAR
ncbi:MAG TPA: VRR-NUC domain-containing protein [Burkholderiales bacterium]|nr:VRR-NUC domain-containing protein [Burkholderiales bacterium]